MNCLKDLIIIYLLANCLHLIPCVLVPLFVIARKANGKVECGLSKRTFEYLIHQKHNNY